MIGGTAEGGGLLASVEIRELKDEVVLIEADIESTARKQETLEQESY